MKKIFFISAFILAAGCSSKPTTSHETSGSSYEHSDVSGQKAAPAPGTPSTTMYTEPGGASPSLEVAPAKDTSLHRSCKTPLGEIPDGGSATGYMKATVIYPDVCISDTVTCKDGKWSGQAIHKECKIVKKK